MMRKMSHTVVVLLPVVYLFFPGACVAEPKDASPAMVGGPFEVKTVKDVAYYDGKDADKAKHKLDLYLPKDQKDFPVLLFVHGGAWVWGDKWMYAGLGNVFARNGVGFIATSYRLSPGVKHPGHIEDVAKAFAWTHKNIGKYGGKPDRIFVTGHSAGGHLSALLATDESYLKAEKLSFGDIRGCAPLSGVYTTNALKIFKDVFGTDEEVCRHASPVENVKGKHPPFLIGYADKDFPACDLMSEELGKKLKECKCDAETCKVKGRDHFSIIISMGNETDPMTQAILKFVAKHSELKLKEKK